MLGHGALRQPGSRSVVAAPVEAAEGPARPARRVLARLGVVARFVAVALLSAVLLLALLDWLLFGPPGLAFRLPYDNDSTSAINKILLAGQYPDAQVLYLGDSRVFFGIDPKIVSQECRCGPGYNAAVPSVEPAVLRIMTQRLLERLSPRVVVIGLSQWNLSDAAKVPNRISTKRLIPSWKLAEFGVEDDTAEALREAPGAFWRLYQYRDEVREGLNAFATGVRDGEGRRGFEVFRNSDGRRQLGERDLDRREQQWFDNFSVKGEQAGELRGLLADLRARGIRAIVLAPPLHPEFEDRVRREVDRFQATTRQIATENGATFVDFTEPGEAGVKASDFLDVVHLNQPGATRLSRHLGGVIRQRLEKR
jgi:hypothetical protein